MKKNTIFPEHPVYPRSVSDMALLPEASDSVLVAATENDKRLSSSNSLNKYSSQYKIKASNTFDKISLGDELLQ